jgi:transposase
VVLCQLIPGGAKRHLSATKARSMLSAVRPRDAVGKARKQLALDYAGELDRLDGRLKQLKRQIGEVLAEDPTLAGADRRDRDHQRSEDPGRGR